MPGCPSKPARLQLQLLKGLQLPLHFSETNQKIAQSYYPQHTFFSDPYFGYPIANAILEKGQRLRPLELLVPRDGTVRKTVFAKGIGAGTQTRVSYALPERVFDRFECWLGIHPDLGAEGKVAFRIYADGEAVFNSGTMAGGEPARRVVLPLTSVQVLSIVVESRNDKRGHNYAIVAEPELFKAAAPANRLAAY